MPAPKLVSLTEAADYLGVTTRTIRTYLAEGRISGYILPGGRSIRVDADSLLAAMEPIATTMPLRTIPRRGQPDQSWSGPGRPKKSAS